MNGSNLPKWFWGVSITGLLWNILGVAAFAAQMTMDLSTLPEAQKEFYEGRPGWATAGFGVAVFGGVLGCLGLVMRKRWSVMMLVVCVIGIVVQVGHAIFLGNGIQVFGPSGLVLPVATLAIGVALALFARSASSRGWLT